MSLPFPPDITVGQIALDPINGIVYYKDGDGNLVSSTWNWLQNDLTEISTVDDVTISNNLVVGGDLVIGGDTVSLNVSEVLIEDNILVLNYNFTGPPTLNAGIEVERGTENNVQIIWNEDTNKWQFTNDGETYLDFNSIAVDSVTLGTHTVGDYVESLVAGTGISLENNSGEGSTPTVSIGQDVSTDSSVQFADVTAGNIEIGVEGSNVISSSSFDVVITPSSGYTQINGDLFISQYLLSAIGEEAGIILGEAGHLKNYETLEGNWTIELANTSVNPNADIALIAPIVNVSNNIGISGTAYVSSIGTASGSLTIESENNIIYLNGQIVLSEGPDDGVHFGENGSLSYYEGLEGEQRIHLQMITGGANDQIILDAPNTYVTGNLIADLTGTVSDISNHEISDLSNVEINDPANGDFLRYNGSNWINDPVNLTTDTVGDYVAKLEAGSGIVITNNSGEGATPNIAFSGSINDVADIVITSAVNGQLLEFDGENWVNAVRPSSEPIGHENKDDSVISFDDEYRRFSIEPADGSYTIWCAGKRYVKTGLETVDIPNISGLYYIYFNSSGVLSYKTTFFTWDEDTPTSYVYWNAEDGRSYFFADERHGITLDWATHEYLHRTRGAAIANGFGVNNYTIIGDGTADTDAQIDIANGTFFDEDLQVDIIHAATPTSNTWEQILQGPAEIPVFYKSSTGEWVADDATTFPLKQGSSRPAYNLYSGGEWTTPDVANNHFGISFILATNNLNYPIIAILGQEDYGQKGAAEASLYENLNLDDFPIVEFRPLYKLIYECKDSYSNTPKTAFVEVTDLRSIISGGFGVPTVPVSDHGNMTGLSDDDHTQYLLANGTRDADSLNVTGSLTASTLTVDSIEIDPTGALTNEVLIYNGTKFVADTVVAVADTRDIEIKLFMDVG